MAEITVAPKTCQGKNPGFLKGNLLLRGSTTGGARRGRLPPRMVEMAGVAGPPGQRFRIWISVVRVAPRPAPAAERAWSARVLRVIRTRRTAAGSAVGRPAASK